MFRLFARARRLMLASAAPLAFSPVALAQSVTVLPTITIEAPAAGSGSLTVPAAQQALSEIQRTAGGVAIVQAEDYKTTTPAATLKDVLDYVPGVFVQPKWGEDTRLSIRGSGLSRNFHLRGVQLFMDGIPINTADGYGDYQEIDPTAYRYVEVYKGANALRYGAASLGGAINFVTPSGRDAPLAAFSLDLGSFGFARTQAQAAGVKGAWDGFVTASGQRADGFRDHSDGHAFRGSGNVGYRITPDIETRFYFNGNTVRQRIPGSVTKFSALTAPQTAAVNNLLNDYQRNIDTVRFANKTTARFGDTTVEAGAFVVDRHLMHPIFQWLDYQYDDYGLFGRITDDRRIGNLRNRFIAGVNVHNGRLDNQQFANIRAPKARCCRRQSTGAEAPRSTSRIRCSCCRMSPSSAARSSSTPPAPGRTASLPTATSRGRRSSTCGARAPGCCGTSIRHGRPSQTSRAAPRSPVSAKARAFPRR